MNIFVLDEDPCISAIHLHNRHIVKMILESAQMLSTTINILEKRKDENLLKPSFINHPCTKWVRESKENYIWLLNHFKALLEEYTYRYNRIHLYNDLIDVFENIPNNFSQYSLTPFAQAMPEPFKHNDSILAYRRYYIHTKIQNNFYRKRRYELNNWLLSNLNDDQFIDTNIDKLNFSKKDEQYDINKHSEYIFVFGSNLAGRHGKGAAKYAIDYCNAQYGKGVGMQGNSYAIPTKDENISTLPLSKINVFVNEFLDFARKNIERKFFLTRIGCGLAGYKDEDIAVMFKKSSSNILLPFEWKNLLV